MIISPKTKKILITLGSGLLLAGGIFVLSASSARAASFWDVMTNPSQIFEMILGLLANFIFSIANFFVRLAATLLEFTFSIEKFTDVAVVRAGWQVCRDIANIGFVLVLLVMAFDSVLQLNKYPIKTILPRLVIAALLINFSLVFCGMIIDFSQIMTHYFYEAAVNGNTAGLSGQLAGALNIQSVYTEPADWGEKAKANGATEIIIGIIFGTAILLVAAFSLAAAAIFFIGRIVTLWLLMIFAPIAWLSMIVPGAPEIGGYWNKWWGEFLKWSFFAPVYMFFIYLAILLASTAPITADSAASAAMNSSLKGNPVSGFLANGAYTMLQYIAIIMIMLMGLKYASSSSALGASTVMKAGKSMTGWAKNKAKKYTVDKAVSAGKFGLNKLEAGAAKLAAVNLGGPETRFSGRMRAKAEQIRQRGFAEREKTEKNQSYGKLLDTMSEKDLMSEVNKGSGMMKLIAARKAKEKGLLDKDPTSALDESKYSDKAKNFKEEDYATSKSLEGTAAEIRQRRTDNKPGFEHKKIDDILHSKGIKPGTPEADDYMNKWDMEMAEKEREEKEMEYAENKTAHQEYLSAKSENEKENKKKLEASRAMAREARSVFNSYGIKDDKGMTKEAKELEETRFDIVENDAEREKVVRRSKESGNLDKVKSHVLKDEKALESFTKELSGPEIEEQYKKWGKATKKSFEDNLIKSIQSIPVGQAIDLHEIKKRETFAMLTGKIEPAFGDEHGKLNFGNEGQMKTLAGYIGKMTATSVAKIGHPDKTRDLKIIGQFASPDLVSNVGRERSASTEQKNLFRTGVENNAVSVKAKVVDVNIAAEAKERLQGMGWALTAEAGEKAEKAKGKGQPTT